MDNFYYKKAKSELWFFSLYNEYFLFDFFLDLLDDFDEINNYWGLDSLCVVIKNNLKEGGPDSLVKATNLLHNLFPNKYISAITAVDNNKIDVWTAVYDDENLSYFLYFWLKIKKSIRKNRLGLVRKIKVDPGPYRNTLVLPIFLKNLQFFKDFLPISYDLYDWPNFLFLSVKLYARKRLIKQYFLGYFIYLFKFIKSGKFPKKSVLPDLYYHYKLRKLQEAERKALKREKRLKNKQKK